MSRRRRSFPEAEARRLKRAGLSATAIASCLGVDADAVRVLLLGRRGKRAPKIAATV